MRLKGTDALRFLWRENPYINDYVMLVHIFGAAQTGPCKRTIPKILRDIKHAIEKNFY